VPADEAGRAENERTGVRVFRGVEIVDQRPASAVEGGGIGPLTTR
jgi:hypothetical protein